MSTFEFAAPTLFGLEGIAGDELRRLDIPNVRVENGRVLFSGDETALARANLFLRTAERVLIGGNVRREDRKNYVDKLAAAVILEQWIASGAVVACSDEK